MLVFLGRYYNLSNKKIYSLYIVKHLLHKFSSLLDLKESPHLIV